MNVWHLYFPWEKASDPQANLGVFPDQILEEDLPTAHFASQGNLSCFSANFWVLKKTENAKSLALGALVLRISQLKRLLLCPLLPQDAKTLDVLAFCSSSGGHWRAQRALWRHRNARNMLLVWFELGGPLSSRDWCCLIRLILFHSSGWSIKSNWARRQSFLVRVPCLRQQAITSTL